MGWGRALGIAVPQALSNITSIQNMQINEEQNRRTEEAFQVNKASANIDLARKQREEKRLTQWIPADQLFREFAPDTTPEAQNEIITFAKDAKVLEEVGGVLGGTREGVTNFIASQKSNFELGQIIADKQFEGYNKQYAVINQQLADPKTKPDDRANLEKQRDDLLKKIDVSAKAITLTAAKKLVMEGKLDISVFNEALRTGDLSKLKEPPKAELKPVVGPEGKPVYKPVTGEEEIPYEVPTPEKEVKPQTGYFKWLSDKGLQDSPSNERAYLDFVKRERTAKGPAIKVDIGFTKATQTELEKGQMEKEQQIMELEEIENLYKSEYLTYKGQGKAFVERLANKAGFVDDPSFLKGRTEWFVQAKASFFKYRKWVTGVAGGQPEMVDIAKAYPDPERNSPTEYESNLKQTKKWAKKVLNWHKYTRAKGLSISDTPENITIPKRATPSINLQNFSDDELMEMLEGTQ